MKSTPAVQRILLGLAFSVSAFVLIPATALAASISKADNTDNLNLTTSWAGVAVPGTADIAQWTSTVTAANTTASLGADLSWLGIKIVGPNAAVTINPGNTLTVGSSGIDLSTATKDLALNCGLTLRNTGLQSWKAASGRTLNLAGTFTRAGTMVDFNSFNAAATLSGLANAGSTGILGPWATTGTGTSNTLNYVKSTDGVIAAFTGQTPATSSTDLSNVTDANVNYSYINATTTFSLDCWQTSFGSGPITVNGNAVAINLYYRHAALVSNSITVNGVGGYLRTIGGTFAGPITLNANTITMSNISGNISGVGGVNHNLAGNFTFSGTNTYTGPTTVTVGTLKAGKASVPNVSGAFGLNSAVSIANAASAILDINGNNTQIGSLTGGGTTGGSVTNSSATIAATLTVGGNNTSTAYAGVVSGTKLSLCKIGSGTLTLSGTNTYGGNTAVSAATLSLSPTVAGGYLADGADVYLTTGAVLNLNTGSSTSDTIRSLYIDGAPQAVGVWGADGSGAEHTSPLITGAGKLNVTSLGTSTTYSISGTVTLNGAGVAGATVSDGTRTATTGADGTYTIANVPDGITYTVTPSKSGYTFAPANLSLILQPLQGIQLARIA